MKTFALIVICAIAVLAIVEYTQAQQLCDDGICGQDCFDQGLHGQCDPDDICRCYNCIFKACRKYCGKQNRIGQCDEDRCLCL